MTSGERRGEIDGEKSASEQSERQVVAATQAECPICAASDWQGRPGHLRDAPTVGVRECLRCGVVVPDRRDAVAINYAHGSMHGDESVDIAEWRRAGFDDDSRRARAILSKTGRVGAVLDVGCGSGGFISVLRESGREVVGVELDVKATEYCHAEGLPVFGSLSLIPEQLRASIETVTMFHVLEHIPEPLAFLAEIVEAVPNADRFIVEVPCSEDPLLTLWGSVDFARFTYWSHHEHLHSQRSLDLLLSGVFDTVHVERLQRYGLSNHLGWLAQGKPGGQEWLPWLEGTPADQDYRNRLIEQGFSDTLWAEARRTRTGASPTGIVSRPRR